MTITTTSSRKSFGLITTWKQGSKSVQQDQALELISVPQRSSSSLCISIDADESSQPQAAQAFEAR